MKIKAREGELARYAALLAEMIEAVRPFWRPGSNDDHHYTSPWTRQIEAAVQPFVAALSIADCARMHDLIGHRNFPFEEHTIAHDVRDIAWFVLEHRILDDEAETPADIIARLQFLVPRAGIEGEGAYCNKTEGDGIVNGLRRTIADIERLTGEAPAVKKAA